MAHINAACQCSVSTASQHSFSARQVQPVRLLSVQHYITACKYILLVQHVRTTCPYSMSVQLVSEQSVSAEISAVSKYCLLEQLQACQNSSSSTVKYTLRVHLSVHPVRTAGHHSLSVQPVTTACEFSLSSFPARSLVKKQSMPACILYICPFILS